MRNASLLTLTINNPTPADQARSRSEKITELIDEELTRAAQVCSTAIEHNRARTLTARDVRQANADFGGRVRYPALCQAVGGNLALANFHLTRIAGVSIPDVQSAAAYLSNTRRVYLLPGLSDPGPALPTALTTKKMPRSTACGANVLRESAAPPLIPVTNPPPVIIDSTAI